MKKNIIAALVAVAVSQIAHADVLQDVNNAVGLSFGLSHLDYVESDSRNQLGGKPLDSENGNQYAFRASIVRDGDIGPVTNVYTELTASFSAGSVKYNGYQLDVASTTGFGHKVAFSHNPMQYDLGIKIGKTFRIQPKFQITPYLSYGYHRWNRFDSEYYTHHEVGGGILAQYALTDKIVLGLDVNAAEVIGGQAYATGIPTYRLSSKPAIGVTVSGEYAVSKHLHLTASYNYRRFSYGQSNGSQTGVYGNQYSTGWFEPASKTNSNTVMIGAKYVF